jgi:hypothetical protein
MMYLCQVPDADKLIGVIALILWQILEFWLGKTEKVKAGSTPELVNHLIISGVKFIWRLIWKKPTI